LVTDAEVAVPVDKIVRNSLRAMGSVVNRPRHPGQVDNVIFEHVKGFVRAATVRGVPDEQITCFLEEKAGKLSGITLFEQSGSRFDTQLLAMKRGHLLYSVILQSEYDKLCTCVDGMGIPREQLESLAGLLMLFRRHEFGLRTSADK